MSNDKTSEETAKKKKGGNGNPAQPELIRPQFYTFVQQDAAHPTGEAVEACALLWLGESAIAALPLTPHWSANGKGGFFPSETAPDGAPMLRRSVCHGMLLSLQPR
mgnify:CR=1 FL=1